jgi:AcrR family transcriptional regulator
VANQRPRLTREGIVAEARTTVARDGLAALSLRRLAAKLGVTAPALYLHFDSKDALLAAIGEVEFTKLLDDLEHAAADGAGPIETIKAQARAYVHYAVANPAFFEILFEFRPAWALEADSEQFPVVAKTFEIAAAPVDSAIRAGLFRPIDPLIAALTIWSAVHGLATLLVNGSLLNSNDEDVLLQTVVDTIVAGMMQQAV